MKVKIDVKLVPFPIPQSVTVRPVGVLPRETIVDSMEVMLSDLDELTLDEMCNEFRTAVFKKAGKRQPPTEAPNTTGN